jgi:hypothetical protein
MSASEMNSESIIIDNCVITKFSGEEQKGLRICKISWFENRIGRSASSLFKITTGSRLNDNLIISDLSENKITYDEVINAWNRGKIGDLTRKYKDIIRSASLEAPSLPPSPWVVEPAHFYSPASLFDIVETLKNEIPKKNIDITHFDSSKSKFKCEALPGSDECTGFIIRIFKDQGYHLIELQRRNGERSIFYQAFDIIASVLANKNMIADHVPRSYQSFHQFKHRTRNQINTSFAFPLPPSPLQQHL